MASVEQRRITDGLSAGEKPTGQLLAVGVRCDGDAAEVLARCREVMAVVVEHATGQWVSDEQWYRVLPDWFVSASAPDLTPQQTTELMVHREAMSVEQRRVFDAERSQRWSVGAFVSNFDPEERAWYWWSAEMSSAELFRIVLVADDWPVPVGALDWLIRAAGGCEVDVDLAY